MSALGPAAADPVYQHWQQLLRPAGKGQVAKGGQDSLVEIDLNQASASLPGQQGQLGRWVDRAGSADEQHAIAPLHLLPAGLQHRRRYGLAEHDRIQLEDAPALRTPGRQLHHGETFPGAAASAANAAEPGAVAVDLHQGNAARTPLEIIHILGDGVFEYPQTLQLHQGVMPRIGNGLVNGPLQLVHRVS